MKVKRGRYGDVRWTGMGMVWDDEARRYVRQGYVMVVSESRGFQETTQGTIEVRGNADSDGWDVVVCGEVVAHEDRKTDAQRLAESLVD